MLCVYACFEVGRTPGCIARARLNSRFGLLPSRHVTSNRQGPCCNPQGGHTLWTRHETAPEPAPNTVKQPPQTRHPKHASSIAPLRSGNCSASPPRRRPPSFSLTRSTPCSARAGRGSTTRRGGSKQSFWCRCVRARAGWGGWGPETKTNRGRAAAFGLKSTTPVSTLLACPPTHARMPAPHRRPPLSLPRFESNASDQIHQIHNRSLLNPKTNTQTRSLMASRRGTRPSSSSARPTALASSTTPCGAAS